MSGKGVVVRVVALSRRVCSGLLAVGKLVAYAVQLRYQRFVLQVHCIKLYLGGISLYGDLKKAGLERDRLISERDQLAAKRELLINDRRQLLLKVADALVERDNLLLKLADRKKPANKIECVHAKASS